MGNLHITSRVYEWQRFTRYEQLQLAFSMKNDRETIILYACELLLRDESRPVATRKRVNYQCRCVHTIRSRVYEPRVSMTVYLRRELVLCNRGMDVTRRLYRMTRATCTAVTNHRSNGTTITSRGLPTS